jgi:hypothetical protein
MQQVNGKQSFHRLTSALVEKLSAIMVAECAYCGRVEGRRSEPKRWESLQHSDMFLTLPNKIAVTITM